MDEAGYGPNLGPLLITATKWRTPASPGRCQFYRLLRDVIDPGGHHSWGKLHLADSKVVFSGKDAFRSLETSALSLLVCLGWKIDSFHALWSQLRRPSGQTADEAASPAAARTGNPADVRTAIPPWYHGDVVLPVAARIEQIQDLAARLKSRMQASGLELVDIRGDLVIEERFNRLVEADGSNKGIALSRLAFQLLCRLWSPGEPDATLFVGDKHGGRNRYDELLAEVLDNHMIFRLEEGQQLSRYRVGRTEFRFQVGGEEHLPVACASIIAKYLRELAMDLFNQFWAQHCPDVKPTRGYPVDARRFRDSIEPARERLGIAENTLWRSR